jgi:hypothetical protein
MLPTSGSGARRSRRQDTRTQFRHRRLVLIGGVLAVVALLALAVSTALGGSSSSKQPAASTVHLGGVPAPPTSNAIKAENAKPGTKDWMITSDDPAHRPIEGWASRVSAQRGESVLLFATTKAASFHVEAYRMGWYGGDGGRLIWKSSDVPGKQQVACDVVPRIVMVDCSKWDPSTTIKVGDDWPPGEYIFKLVTNAGGAGFVPFTVRDDASKAAVLLVNPVTTWQAYNAWGGHSLYGDQNGKASARSNVVSFDRPYLIGWAGSGHYFGGTNETVQLLESEGIDVTYSTNVDQQEHPELLKQHKVVLSMSHDEYYSTTMRSALQSARDAGVNLVFFGANAIFRRIRFEPSALGADRHIVNYRVAANDPLNGKDQINVTTSWRDPPHPNPESSLIGELYECNPVSAPLVVTDPGAWMFAGTQITAGEKFPEVVGNEYDRVTPELPTPANVQVLAHSPVTCRNRPSFADMTYYTAPSAAGVFASGTLYLQKHMGPLCAAADYASNGDCKLRKLMANVIATFADGPAGKAHPSKDNLASLGIHAGYIAPYTGPGDERSLTDDDD